jgi:hypothetical protein
LSANQLTSYISRPSIIAAGASHLDRLVDNPKALLIVREAYNAGIKDTMIVALAAICLCLPCLLGMEWLKLGSAQSNIERVGMVDNTSKGAGSVKRRELL